MYTVEYCSRDILYPSSSIAISESVFFLGKKNLVYLFYE